MFSIPVFHGTKGEDPASYFWEFNWACCLTGWSMKERIEILPDFLEGVALTWHEALSKDTRSDWRSLIRAMKDRFAIVESPN